MLKISELYSNWIDGIFESLLIIFNLEKHNATYVMIMFNGTSVMNILPATHPALQPYKKYIPQIKQKYWEHLKENVWLESYRDLR